MTSPRQSFLKSWWLLGLVLGVIGWSFAGWRVSAREDGRPGRPPLTPAATAAPPADHTQQLVPSAWPAKLRGPDFAGLPALRVLAGTQSGQVDGPASPTFSPSVSVLGSPAQ